MPNIKELSGEALLSLATMRLHDYQSDADLAFMDKARAVLSRAGEWDGDPCVFRYSPTGEEFVSLTTGGIKEEGEHIAIIARSRDAAERVLLFELADYAKDKADGATIYWRCYPEFNSDVFYEVDTWSAAPIQNMPRLSPVEVWFGYCRILISDKPVLSHQCSDMYEDA